MIIGLTGISGSGKSEVAEIMQNNGALIIDCDEMAHKNMAVNGVAYKEIADFFGDGILDENGSIDRKKLGGIVFSDSKKLETLNRITHKYIKEEILSLIAENKNRKCLVIDAPLLFEAGLEKYCDEVWAVHATPEKRLERIEKRDGISRETAEKRLNNQMDDDEFMALCDVVIENSSSLEELENKVVGEMKNKELIQCSDS